MVVGLNTCNNMFLYYEKKNWSFTIKPIVIWKVTIIITCYSDYKGIWSLRQLINNTPTTYFIQVLGGMLQSQDSVIKMTKWIISLSLWFMVMPIMHVMQLYKTETRHKTIVTWKIENLYMTRFASDTPCLYSSFGHFYIYLCKRNWTISNRQLLTKQ